MVTDDWLAFAEPIMTINTGCHRQDAIQKQLLYSTELKPMRDAYGITLLQRVSTACYAERCRLLAIVNPSVCPSVCLSFTVG